MSGRSESAAQIAPCDDPRCPCEHGEPCSFRSVTQGGIGNTAGFFLPPEAESAAKWYERDASHSSLDDERRMLAATEQPHERTTIRSAMGEAAWCARSMLWHLLVPLRRIPACRLGVHEWCDCCSPHSCVRCEKRGPE